MNESLMGRRSGDRTESWRMFADLQGDFAALAEKTEGMFANPEVIKNATFAGYFLGIRAHKELGDRAADVDRETVTGMLKDLLLEAQDTVLDALDQLNDRDVRPGEQPGEASFQRLSPYNLAFLQIRLASASSQRLTWADFHFIGNAI